MILFFKYFLLAFSLSCLASSPTKWEGRGLNAYVKEKLKINAPFLEKYNISSYREKNELVEIWSKKFASNIFLEIHKQTENTNEFENFKKSNLIIVRNLYRATPSPYPGAISKGQEGCGNENAHSPKEYEVNNRNLNFAVFEGAASSRFVLGVCNPGEITYQGFLVFFKAGEYYSLMRIFIPLNEYLSSKEFIRTSLQSLFNLPAI